MIRVFSFFLINLSPYQPITPIMSRVKGGIRHAQRRRNILKHAHGFRWGRKSKIKLAHTAVARKFRFAWESRRLKKRTMRQNWHITLNAALHPHGLHWGVFIPALKKEKIELNRKMLAELAQNHPTVFLKVVEAAKPHVSQKSITPA